MNNELIVGVDEAGRGPLAGPVIAGAVILDNNKPIIGLADSKLLSAKKREQLEIIIKQSCLAWAIGRAEVQEIDSINILQASLLAMQRAINKLTIKPTLALIDGQYCPQNILCRAKAIIGGDKTEPAISAASILAKVARDREMVTYDATYPNYGLAVHKGYGTKQHLAAIKKYGITPLHRKSFQPIKSIIKDAVRLQQ